MLVDTFGRFEDFEVDADGSGEIHKGLKIFRDAEAAETESGAEKLSADTASSPMAWSASSRPAPIFSQRSAMTLA